MQDVREPKGSGLPQLRFARQIRSLRPRDPMQVNKRLRSVQDYESSLTTMSRGSQPSHLAATWLQKRFVPGRLRSDARPWVYNPSVSSLRDAFSAGQMTSRQMLRFNTRKLVITARFRGNLSKSTVSPQNLAPMSIHRVFDLNRWRVK